MSMLFLLVLPLGLNVVHRQSSVYYHRELGELMAVTDQLRFAISVPLLYILRRKRMLIMLPDFPPNLIPVILPLLSGTIV
jgi:hypothetical protein